MKIIVALDSFKGSMSSSELNAVVKKRLKKEIKDLEIVEIPISDGGEGFLESYSHNSEFETVETIAHNPLMKRIETTYLLNKSTGTAIIESAEIIGLDKVDKLEPLKASSFGLGEVVLDAISNGAKEIIVGLGGSATNDAGVGMLKALNYEFFDVNDNYIDICISNMHKVASLKSKDNMLNEVKFQAITDVKNIFTGMNGASNIFGPQKGLSEKDIEYVDKQFKSFKILVKEELDIDMDKIVGTGAAGGISGAMKAFLNAEILPGIDFILESVDFEKHCEDTDYVITGEGRIDHQSFYGKVIQGVSEKACLYNIPVIALGGSVDIHMLKQTDEVYPSIFSIVNDPISLEDAMVKEKTKSNLDFTVKNICILLNLK